MKYLLDTNIINWLIDGKLTPEELPQDSEFVATHIQIDEINGTSDEERRARLILCLQKTIKDLRLTETVVLDISRYDNCKSGDGVLYEWLKKSLDSKSKQPVKREKSNIRDALIAEVAIINELTLITADKDLAEVTEEHGGVVELVLKKAVN